MSDPRPPHVPTAPVASVPESKDPVASAAEVAPVDDLPETEEERAAVAAAKANPRFVPGSTVSAMIADRRRREEG